MEDTKPIELQELESYMTKYDNSKKESPNDIFTKLLINNKLHQAIKMIDNNKDLKYNMDLYYACDDGLGSCKNAFNTMIKDICMNSDYMSVIKLLQFLEPKNIIGGICCDCNDLTHDYVNYCWNCVYYNYTNTARAIYIMFDVDSSSFLGSCCYKNDVKNAKIAYEIIKESKDIIRLKRQNELTLYIYHLYDQYDIMEWYYSISPMSFTKDNVNELLQEVKSRNYRQLSKFEKFFESINIE